MYLQDSHVTPSHEVLNADLNRPRFQVCLQEILSYVVCRANEGIGSVLPGQNEAQISRHAATQKSLVLNHERHERVSMPFLFRGY